MSKSLLVLFCICVFSCIASLLGDTFSPSLKRIPSYTAALCILVGVASLFGKLPASLDTLFTAAQTLKEASAEATQVQSSSPLLADTVHEFENRLGEQIFEQYGIKPLSLRIEYTDDEHNGAPARVIVTLDAANASVSDALQAVLREKLGVDVALQPPQEEG